MILQKLPAFTPVAAGSKAILKVPRYALTLTRIVLTLGGTTFPKSYATEIWVKLGSHAIWETDGTYLDKINKYKGVYDEDHHLTLDFTERDASDIVGKEIGGIDLSKLTDDVYIEVKISASASAPTLSAIAFFTPPQGAMDSGQLIKKIVKVTTGTMSAGRGDLAFSPNGALLQRIYSFFTGTDWAASATAAAWTGNTGNGAMGAVTVSAGAQIGVHRFVAVEPGTNVGTFIHELPDGTINPLRMIVAAAYSSGGLAFTLADGSTDFIVGDGFDITVSKVSNGNIADMRVKKNGVPVWDEIPCNDARFIQKEYKKVPQSLCYVTDFIVDNNQSGALVTADAASLQIQPNLTASDTLTNFFEVLDVPYNL